MDAATDPNARADAADTLGLTEEEMRRLGYRVVDLVVDRLAGRGRTPAIRTGSPAALATQLGGAPPEQPLDPEESLDLLAKVALAHQQNGDHPRYFARVPGPSSFAAILGEWLGVGFNAMAASWTGGSGPATVELVVIDWLRQLMGLPEGTDGVLVSGGSLANLTAFATAREALGPGVAYLTDQTHASLRRDLAALGFPPEHVCVIPSDAAMRMPLASLRAAIAADREAGRRPMLIIATAGTTNTGAVDPLEDIADLCRAEGLWFHVDGAYGAPAALIPEGQAAMPGLERADSLVLDPHKWLFQPYDVGAVLVSRPGALERCFAMTPEYLKDVHGQDGEVDFRNRSLELSRRSRALKLWMTVRTYGLARIRDGIARGMVLAAFAGRWLAERPETWDVVSPPALGIVCFALRGVDADGHEARARALAAGGYACVSTTVLRGRTVFRLCTINPLTTETDILGTLERLAGGPSEGKQGDDPPA